MYEGGRKEDMYDLAAKVAVVTGGAQGIGAAIAHRLADEGAAVAILDVSDRADEVAKEIAGAGGRATWIRTDVRDRGQVEAAFAETAESLGSPDILVSNAGVTRDNLIHKMTDDDWDMVIDTHLRGGYLCAQVAQRYMVPRKYGKMVFISSRANQGSRGQANYAAAKAGLFGLARTLSIELGRYNVNVNVVVPGHMDTQMVRDAAVRAGIDYDEMCRRTIERNAIKRVGEGRDIANAVAFLVSDESSFITGDIMHVSGRPPI
jgi:3-oxoacyl-[acyl-carrier protein] reductase